MQTAPVVTERRAAGWYELFFDLVFVVVIALSARLIEVDPAPLTVLVFVLLFFPLWWAWVNLMLTVNLFVEGSPSLPVALVLSMPGPAAMAIAISAGVDHYAWLYAAGAVWVRLALIVMWLIPRIEQRSSNPFWRVVVYNLVPAALWLGALAAPVPYRYLIWAVALLIEVLLLALPGATSEDIYLRVSVSHALERVGLFVVIVIGEAVYLGVTTLTAHLSVAGGAAAIFGFLVCALLARSFFRFGVPTAEVGLLEAQRSHRFGPLRDSVMYLPFLLVTGLTLISAIIGIAVERGVEPLAFAPRIILFAGAAGFYVTNSIIGIRLRRRISSILLLLVPAILLTAAACLPAELPAWVTLALVAVALGILDVLSSLLGRASHPHHHHHG